MTLLRNNAHDACFPYKAVLPKNLAQVFRFSSIKKRFQIIWELESNQNTRMNIPTLL